MRQKSKGGQYYYRLTIAQGNRKEFSLGTSDPDEACRKAEELDSIWLAPTSEVALAQMNAIRQFSKKAKKISFEEGWDIYQAHPDRATPHTVEERIGYRKTYELFSQFASGAIGKSKRAETICICDQLGQAFIQPRTKQRWKEKYKMGGVFRFDFFATTCYSILSFDKERRTLKRLFER